MLKVTGMIFRTVECVVIPASAAAVSALITRIPAAIAGADVMNTLSAILAIAAGGCLYYLLLLALGNVRKGEAAALICAVKGE